MIGKLGEDQKACWSEYLPELLLAYNATCLAVTWYSPYYLLFGRRHRLYSCSFSISVCKLLRYYTTVLVFILEFSCTVYDDDVPYCILFYSRIKPYKGIQRGLGEDVTVMPVLAL